jgi:hypothetical protein
LVKPIGPITDDEEDSLARTRSVKAGQSKMTCNHTAEEEEDDEDDSLARLGAVKAGQSNQSFKCSVFCV